MKNYRSLIIVSLLILINGCCWYSPWRSEEYIHNETKQVHIGINGNEKLPDQNKFHEFFVNGAFISVSITAHNRTTTSGSSPYCIAISAHGAGNTHNVLKIYGIKVLSNLQNEHHLFPENTFPIDMNFEPFHVGDMVWAHFSSPYNLKLDFDEKEQISIILDVEVQSVDNSERKNIEFEFAPYLREGSFQCVHV